MNPTDMRALLNLGAALHDLGQRDEAVTHFRMAVDLDPAQVEAYRCLGRALVSLGRWAEAFPVFQQAVLLQPQDASLNLDLGIALHTVGRFSDAIACYLHCLNLAPDTVLAHYNLARSYQALGRFEEAIAHFQRVLGADPAFFEAWRGLGEAYQDQDMGPEADAAFQRALALRDDPGLQVRMATRLPIVPASHAELLASRQDLSRRLEELLAAGLTLSDPLQQVGRGNFYLAFDGWNERPLLEKIARFYLTVCPDLAWMAPHCHPDAAPRSVNAPIRIGIISQHLHGHVISTVSEGIIRRLDRGRFHVTVLQAGKEDDTATVIGEAADVCIRLSGSLAAMRQVIADQAFDLILYPDIGMDAMNYFLGFARLAPVQCVLTGHPITTGLSTIDYFLSTAAFEPPEADEHYTERLIRLDDPPVYYYKPEVTPDPAIRQRFGLDPAWRLYACLQTLFKFHPDFDAILAAILRLDPGGRIVLTEGATPNWTTRLLTRLQKACPGAADRIIVIPRLPYADFMQVLATADVLLDPLHFVGGTTSLSAFAVGKAIITLRGAFCRGRVTAGLYDRMGMSDVVAADPADYVAKALRLAHDAAWRQSLKERITACHPLLFEREVAVQQLESFFEKAVAVSRTMPAPE